MINNYLNDYNLFDNSNFINKTTEIAKSFTDNQSKTELTYEDFIKDKKASIDGLVGLYKFINPKKAIGLINLSFEAKDTGLEGWQTSAVATLYHSILQMIALGQGVFSSKHLISSSILSVIQQLKQQVYFTSSPPDGDDLKKMNIVAALKPLESHYFAGGWYGDPVGHAVIFRFERLYNNCYNIYIYNAESSQGGIQTSTTVKSIPYILFQNVEWEEIFFCSYGKQELKPILFKTILSLNYRDFITYTMKDLLNCFHHISHRQANFLLDENFPSVIATQKCGNCSVKSMNCLLFDLVKNPIDYKKVSLDIKLFTIISFEQVIERKNFQTLEEKKHYLFLLKEAISHFLKTLDYNLKKGKIEEKEYQTAFAISFHLFNKIKDLDLPLEQPDQGDHLNIYAPNKIRADAKKRLNYISDKHSGTYHQYNSQYNSQFYEATSFNTQLGKDIKWEKLEDVLGNLASICHPNYINNNNNILQIEMTLKNLSHLKTQVNDLSLSEVEALSCLKKLENIQNLYSRYLKDHNFSLFTIYNTILECIALAYCLALKADKSYGFLKEFHIDTNFLFSQIEKNNFSSIQTPDLLLQYQQLEKFFCQFVNPKNRLFIFDEFLTQEEFIERKDGEMQLYRLYFQSYQSIEKSFIQLDAEKCSPVKGSYQSYLGTTIDKFPTELHHLYYLKLVNAHAYGICYVNSNLPVYTGALSKMTVGLRQWDRLRKSTPIKPGNYFDKKTFDKAKGNETALDNYLEHPLSQHSFKYEVNKIIATTYLDHFYTPFYQALSEPKVQITILLNILEQNFEKISEVYLRQLIKLMTFKLVRQDGILTSPFIDALQTNPSLIKKIEDLVQLGQKYFIDAHRLQALQIQEMLFLWQFYAQALYISRSLNHPLSETTQEKIESIFKELDRLLKNADEELVHEINLIKLGLLLGDQPKHLNEKVELFYLMFFLKNSLGTREINDRFFWNECERYYFSHPILLDPSEYHEFAHKVLQKLDNSVSGEWTFKDDCLHLTNPSFSWSIQLQTFEISHDNAKITFQGKQTLPDAIKNYPIFNLQNPRHLNINQNKKYDIKSIKHYLYFNHEIWGELRLDGRYLERKINDQWALYTIPPYFLSDGYQTTKTILPSEIEGFIEKLKINRSIYHRTIIWKLPTCLIFCDPITGNILYQTNDAGKITHQITDQVFSPIYKCPLLEKFENPQFINFWYHKKQQTLEFSRLKDRYHQKLSFTLKNKCWHYNQNEDFFICTEPFDLSDLSISCLLFLTNQDRTKQKILIPICEISSAGFTPIAKIDHDAIAITSNNSHKLKKLTYLEYDIINQQIICPNLESKVYLIYIYLAQRDYNKAFTLLQTISNAEKPSKKSNKILDYILNRSATKLKDLSPNACAIRLLIYYKFRNLMPSEGHYLTLNFTKDFKIYINGQKNLDALEQIETEIQLELIEDLKQRLLVNSENSVSNQFKQIMNLHLTNHQSYLKTNKNSKFLSLPLISTLNLINNPPFLPFINNKDNKDNILENIFSDVNPNKITISPFLNSIFLKSFKQFSYYYQLLSQKHSDKILYSTAINEFLYELTINYSISQKRYLTNIDHPRLKVLILIINSSQPIPPLPPQSASKKEKIEWLEKIFEIQSSIHLSSNNFKDSINKRIFPPQALVYYFPPLINNLAPPNQNVVISKPKCMVVNDCDNRFNFWQSTFLNKILENQSDLFIFNDISIQHAEKKYELTIKTHQDFYKQDCFIAHQSLQNRNDLIKTDINSLVDLMQNEVADCLKQEEVLKQYIHQLVHKRPVEFQNFAHHMTQLLAYKYPDKIPLETILNHVILKDFNELKKLNSVLDEKDYQDLYNVCIEFMLKATHRQYIQQILELLNKGLKTQNSFYIKQAGDLLSIGRNYNPIENHFYLLFEYLSEIRLSKKQLTIISSVVHSINQRNLTSLGKAFQLIMAGGKTSVILSILLEVASMMGYAPLVMSHYSQMTSITGTLAELQSKRFNKDIYVIDYQFSQLSDLMTLNLIGKQLVKAKTKKFATIMKTKFSQLLELKFILELLKLSKTETQTTDQLTTINLLRNINLHLRTVGIGFYDECDTNLSILSDVIIPLDRKKEVEPEKSSLITHVFECLASDKNILEWIQQPSQEVLQFQIIPFLADKIFDYAPLQLNHLQRLKKAFKRYLCNEISYSDQNLVNEGQKIGHTQEQDENVYFLSYLRGMAYSLDLQDRQSATLISLLRHLTIDILPIAFSRSYNRGYGKSLTNNNGKIIPYLAARTPATTQFANVYLELVYQAQAAIYDQVTASEIQFIAEKMNFEASRSARYEKTLFNETQEFQQFLKLTSITLEDISFPDQIEKAIQFINSTVFNKLQFAKKLGSYHVRYYPQHMTSNAINAVSKFKKAVACSGTLWNHSTYHKGFGPALLDQGTEGSIINLLSEKNIQIRELRDTTLQDFKTLIQNHPHKNKIRALVDGGGLLKNYSNQQIALEFLSLFAKHLPHITAIVYLHKFTPEEMKKTNLEESFVLLKQGQSTPIILHHTSTEEIEKNGVKKDHVFVLFDELRSIGTNILIADDALFLNTIDQKMSIRSFLQSILRARGIFKEQTTEILVSSQNRKEMLEQGQTLIDIFNTLIKNEALVLQTQKERARIAQINDVIRSAILDELFACQDNNKLKKLIVKYEPFLVKNSEEDLYKQFGCIHNHISAFEFLKTYANHQMEGFAKVQSANHAVVLKNMSNLLEILKKEIHPQETVSTTFNQSLEATLEVETEKELDVEMENENETDLSKDLQVELDNYNYTTGSIPYEEYQWNLKQPVTLQTFKNQIHTIQDILCRSYPSKSVDTSIYKDCFPSNLKMTNNFYRTLTEEIPVFHKKSRTAYFMLTIQENGIFHFILVSEQEAAFFKKHLVEVSSPQVYLTDLSGFAEIQGDVFNQEISSNEKANTEFMKGLWFANLFNGNIFYISNNIQFSRGLISNKKDLYEKFLSLKIGGHMTEMQKLSLFKLFNFVEPISSSVEESKKRTASKSIEFNDFDDANQSPFKFARTGSYFS